MLRRTAHWNGTFLPFHRWVSGVAPRAFGVVVWVPAVVLNEVGIDGGIKPVGKGWLS